MNSPPKINSRPANSIGHRWFRGVAVVFAVALACHAFWILAAEFSRPPPVDFPTDLDSVTDAVANRDAAYLAAKLGIIRGDLWANYALTFARVLRHDDKDSTDAKDPDTIEQARKAAERTLAFAPYDARIWLILASIDSRFDWMNGKASAALRNSYYTGSNEIALIPVRLFLSLSSGAISDSDFQQLVRHDLRTIITHKPEMKSAIAVAYQYALPDGQQFIKDALNDLDPDLLSSLTKKQ